MQGAAEAANTEAIILEAAYEDKVHQGRMTQIWLLIPHLNTLVNTFNNILGTMVNNSPNLWDRNQSLHQSASQKWTTVSQIIVVFTHWSKPPTLHSKNYQPNASM
jgi:hypothetical protein